MWGKGGPSRRRRRLASTPLNPGTSREINRGRGGASARRKLFISAVNAFEKCS